jgi:hypothetical protein
VGFKLYFSTYIPAETFYHAYIISRQMGNFLTACFDSLGSFVLDLVNMLIIYSIEQYAAEVKTTVNSDSYEHLNNLNMLLAIKY